MEPEGITRACPSVPFTSRNTSTTQNQATISCWTRKPSGNSFFDAVFFLAALLGLSFTFHRNFLFESWRAVLFFHFQLHQVCRVHTGVTRCAKLAGSVVHCFP